jgi:hypothetical protein
MPLVLLHPLGICLPHARPRFIGRGRAVERASLVGRSSLDEFVGALQFALLLAIWVPVHLNFESFGVR